MTPARERLNDLLQPVRDVYVAALLETLACELGRGADVEAEPEDRDAAGRLRRNEPLNLPSRRDLRVKRGARTLDRRVAGEGLIEFPTARGRLPGGVGLRIAPFSWGEAEVYTRGLAGRPNWRPFRLWFLEWFQPRFGDETPDLLGCVHAAAGPVEIEGGWRLTVDFGSAPVAAFEAMTEALAATGCAEVRVGRS